MLHPHFFLPSYSVTLSYFNLAVPKCFGKHLCMSSIFPIAMLNGICFFRQCNCKCTMYIRSKKAVREGCVMCPRLFSVYMDGVVREVNVMVLGKRLKLLSANGAGLR